MNTKLKRILVVFFIGYFILQFFSLRIQKKHSPAFHEKVIVSITAPAQWLVRQTYNGIAQTLSNYVFLVRVKKENRVLKDQISSLNQKLVYYRELESENLRLKRIFNLTVDDSFVRVVAQKIASGPTRFEQSIRITKGKKHGLREGLAVVSPDGVVGQIVEVYQSYSDVLLITDPTSRIDVVVQRSRANGMLAGGVKPNQLQFKYLSKESDIYEEDIVIASGLDGIYPKAFPVGKVAAVGVRDKGLFLEATVRPYVEFSNIEEVVVLTPKEEEQ